jgi:hypothetical protein
MLYAYNFWLYPGADLPPALSTLLLYTRILAASRKIEKKFNFFHASETPENKGL